MAHCTHFRKKRLMLIGKTISKCVLAGLLSSTLLAGEPAVPVAEREIYDAFAQADGQAPVTLMPREGVPDEDVYQFRAAAPQEAAVEEGATRYLETQFLLNRGIETYGWVDVGIGANGWGADWNGPITFKFLSCFLNLNIFFGDNMIRIQM